MLFDPLPAFRWACGHEAERQNDHNIVAISKGMICDVVPPKSPMSPGIRFFTERLPCLICPDCSADRDESERKRLCNALLDFVDRKILSHVNEHATELFVLFREFHLYKTENRIQRGDGRADVLFDLFGVAFHRIVPIPSLVYVLKTTKARFGSPYVDTYWDCLRADLHARRSQISDPGKKVFLMMLEYMYALVQVEVSLFEFRKKTNNLTAKTVEALEGIMDLMWCLFPFYAGDNILPEDANPQIVPELRAMIDLISMLEEEIAGNIEPEKSFQPQLPPQIVKEFRLCVVYLEKMMNGKVSKSIH